jgi:hypothetical protein
MIERHNLLVVVVVLRRHFMAQLEYLGNKQDRYRKRRSPQNCYCKQIMPRVEIGSRDEKDDQPNKRREKYITIYKKK